VKVGSVTAGGSLRVAGLARVGSRVDVRGTGFTPGTIAEWQHVRVTELECVSPELLRVHVDGDAELRGKRLRPRDGDSSVDAYFAYPAVRVGDGEG